MCESVKGCVYGFLKAWQGIFKCFLFFFVSTSLLKVLLYVFCFFPGVLSPGESALDS